MIEYIQKVKTQNSTLLSIQQNKKTQNSSLLKTYGYTFNSQLSQNLTRSLKTSLATSLSIGQDQKNRRFWYFENSLFLYREEKSTSDNLLTLRHLSWIIAVLSPPRLDTQLQNIPLANLQQEENSLIEQPLNQLKIVDSKFVEKISIQLKIEVISFQFKICFH